MKSNEECPPETENRRAAMRRLLEHREVVAWRALQRGYETLYEAFGDGLAREGCTYARFQLMFFLYFEGAHAPVELAKKLRVSRANMSMFLQRMVLDALIGECPHSSSSKRPCYRLTPKGVRLFERILPGHVERIRGLMPPVAARQLRVLEDIKPSPDSGR